ncbi:MAG: response regulator [Deinococcales bacterium]
MTDISANLSNHGLTDSLTDILIVDDNELNLRLFHDMLSAKGYRVSIARNGFEGLDMASSLKPRLLLLDIQMPKLSGTDMLIALRQQPKLCHIPVIAVTALAMQQDEENLLAAGFDAYLSKPVSLKKLLLTVESHLKQP